MSTKKKIIIASLFGFVVLAILGLMYLNIETHDSTSIYGVRINVDISKIEFDTFLEIPNGKLGISNTNSSKKNVDTIAPILVKFDKNEKVIWAVILQSNKRIFSILLLILHERS